MTEPVSTVEQLVAARQARGLAVEDILRDLKLSRKQFDAIEQGDWARLPGLAFARGVLRGYGRLLGVDVEPLVASLGATLAAADLRPAASLDQPMPTRSMFGFGSGGSGSRVAWIGLGVAALLVLVLFFARSVDLSAMRSWLGTSSASSDDVRQDTPAGQSGTATETVPLAPAGVPSGPAAPAADAPNTLPRPTNR